MLVDDIESRKQPTGVRSDDDASTSDESSEEKGFPNITLKAILMLSGSLLLAVVLVTATNKGLLPSRSSAGSVAAAAMDDQDMVGPTLPQEEKQNPQVTSNSRNLQEMCSSKASYTVEYGRSPGSHVGRLDGLTGMDECYGQCCQNEDCQAIIFIPNIQSTTRCYLLDRTYEGNFIPHDSYRVANKVTSTPEPTGNPTDIPTSIPTRSPTFIPSTTPTVPPTVSPTRIPTEQPTAKSTDAPANPTQSPTSAVHLERWILGLNQWGVQCTTYLIGSFDGCYCRNNYCLNGGVSSLTPTGCLCQCQFGFGGARCEVPT